MWIHVVNLRCALLEITLLHGNLQLLDSVLLTKKERWHLSVAAVRHGADCVDGVTIQYVDPSYGTSRTTELEVAVEVFCYLSAVSQVVEGEAHLGLVETVDRKGKVVGVHNGMLSCSAS